MLAENLWKLALAGKSAASGDLSVSLGYDGLLSNPDAQRANQNEVNQSAAKQPILSCKSAASGDLSVKHALAILTLL